MSLPILKYCDNNHIYDAAIYETCPYCKKKNIQKEKIEYPFGSVPHDMFDKDNTPRMLTEEEWARGTTPYIPNPDEDDDSTVALDGIDDRTVDLDDDDDRTVALDDDDDDRQSPLPKTSYEEEKSPLPGTPYEVEQSPLPRTPYEVEQLPLPRVSYEEEQSPLPKTSYEEEQSPLPKVSYEEEQSPLPKTSYEEEQSPLPRTSYEEEQSPLPKATSYEEEQSPLPKVSYEEEQSPLPKTSYEEEQSPLPKASYEEEQSPLPNRASDRIQSTLPGREAEEDDRTETAGMDAADRQYEEEIAGKRVAGWLVCTGAGKKYGRSIEIFEGDNLICFDGSTLRCRPKAGSGMRIYGRIFFYVPFKRFVFQKYPAETGYLNGQIVNKSVYLSPYDRISVGDLELVFLPFIGEEFLWE